MFENLSERFGQTIKNLTGRGRLTEENIQNTLREIRVALLEADVALEVIKPFLDRVHEKAIGEEVLKSLSPGQVLIKIVNDALTRMLGEAHAELNLRTQPPAVILMAGLQGSGKTTTVAKLGRLIQIKLQKKVLITSTDIHRPAAIQQLETLSKQTEIPFYSSKTMHSPEMIARKALDLAKQQSFDVLIIDTAGRLHIDSEMMNEIQQIHKIAHPIETLFVVDGMTGQDAANMARSFNNVLPLTGVILTKMDGDTRGGAALSVFGVTGKPIKFVGVGEKVDELEDFHPDRIASRILGMGDIVSLVEQVEQKVDQQKAAKIAKKILKGRRFDLEDFLEQLEQMENLGGLSGLITKLPGIGQLPQSVKNKTNDKPLQQMKVIIQSMTLKERRFPALIKGSRKQRIAQGSGTQIQDVNRLLKQFTHMEKMISRISKKGNMFKMMQQIKDFI
jgi:signal recognition particle subunit SRP54